MTGFLTPQDCEDGCCSGESGGLKCNCASGVDACGNITWECYAPRDFHNIPSKPPHRIRIVKVTESGDTILSVAHESTALSGQWRPSVSGWYRAEICCQDPGYGSCTWESISFARSFYADVSPEACGISVSGIAIRRGGHNGCLSTADIYAAAALRPGACPEGISELSINGQSMISIGSPPSQFAGCLPDQNIDPGDAACGSGFGFGGTCQHPWMAIPYTISLPASGSVTVKAKSHCGDMQICSIQLPCHWAYNAVAAGVPSYGGEAISCSGGDAKPFGWDDFGGGNGMRWKQSWSANFSLSLSWGGTYIPLTCDGAPGEVFDEHRTVGEGLYSGHYEESGLVKFIDPNGSPVYHPYYIEQSGTFNARAVISLNYTFGGTLQGLSINIVRKPSEVLALTVESLQPTAWNNAGSPQTNVINYADARFTIVEFMRVNPTTLIGCQLSPPVLAVDWSWERRTSFPLGILVGPGLGISPFSGGCPGGANPWISAGSFPAALVGVAF